MKKIVTGIALLVAAGAAMAETVAGPNMTALVSAVSVDTVIVAVLSIFGIGMGLTLAFKGGEKSNTAVKRL